MPDDVKFFDHIEARWQDEKAHEDFTDYALACQARFGARFVSLTPEPFVLKLRDETFSIKDNQVYHEVVT